MVGDRPSKRYAAARLALSEEKAQRLARLARESGAPYLAGARARYSTRFGWWEVLVPANTVQSARSDIAGLERGIPIMGEEVRRNPSFNVHLKRGDAWAVRAARTGQASAHELEHVRTRKLARRRRVPPVHKWFGLKPATLLIGVAVIGGALWWASRNKGAQT